MREDKGGIVIAVKIDKLRYFKCGYEAPKNSNFKGIMTCEAFVGYFNYTSREEAKEEEKDLEQNVLGYFEYTSNHHAAPTRSSIGVLDTEEKIQEFKNLVKPCFNRKGDLAWENVLSIQDYTEAEKLGLYSIDDWEIALSKALPKFFKYAGYDPKNMIWWWDYHVNKSHPHVHIVWMEKNKTKTQGYLPPKQLEALKRYTVLELEARKRLCEKINISYEEFFKKKDMQFKEIVFNVEEYLKKEKNISILSLYKILPKTGRLQYNSYSMKEYKPMIDKIIDDLIVMNPEVNKAYNQWLKNIDLINQNSNELQNSSIDSFKEAEIKKLYTRLGNKILQMYKESPTEIKNTANKTDKRKGIKRYINSSRSKITYNSANKILGIYCMGIINEQEKEMEESLREFLSINELEN